MIDFNDFNRINSTFNKFVPLVYDDSISLYEWLNKFVKNVTDYINSIAYDISGKVDKTTYNADKATFEYTSNRVNSMTGSLTAENKYPSCKAVNDFTKDTFVKKSDVITDTTSATDTNVLSAKWVNDNAYTATGTYNDFATTAKTVVGAIAELKSRIGNPNVYLAEYDETSFADVLSAYNDDRTVVLLKEKTVAFGTYNDFMKLNRVVEQNGSVTMFIFVNAYGASLETVTLSTGDVWETSTTTHINQCINNFAEGEEVTNLPYNCDVVYGVCTALQATDATQQSAINTINSTIENINTTLSNHTTRFNNTMKTAVIERQATFTDGECTITGLNLSPITTGNTFVGSVVVNGLATGNCFVSSILDATATSASVYIKCVTEDLTGSANIRITCSSL